MSLRLLVASCNRIYLLTNFKIVRIVSSEQVFYGGGDSLNDNSLSHHLNAVTGTSKNCASLFVTVRAHNVCVLRAIESVLKTKKSIDKMRDTPFEDLLTVVQHLP